MNESNKADMNNAFGPQQPILTYFSCNVFFFLCVTYNLVGNDNQQSFSATSFNACFFSFFVLFFLCTVLFLVVNKQRFNRQTPKCIEMIELTRFCDGRTGRKTYYYRASVDRNFSTLYLYIAIANWLIWFRVNENIRIITVTKEYQYDSHCQLFNLVQGN